MQKYGVGDLVNFCLFGASGGKQGTLGQWVPAVISCKDVGQVQVTYDDRHQEMSYWCHLDMVDAIKPLL